MLTACVSTGKHGQAVAGPFCSMWLNSVTTVETWVSLGTETVCSMNLIIIIFGFVFSVGYHWTAAFMWQPILMRMAQPPEAGVEGRGPEDTLDQSSVQPGWLMWFLVLSARHGGCMVHAISHCL